MAHIRLENAIDSESLEALNSLQKKSLLEEKTDCKTEILDSNSLTSEERRKIREAFRKG